MAGCGGAEQETASTVDSLGINDQLRQVLNNYGFTGTIESQLEARLGRPIDAQAADLGRLLFFDKIQALHRDNPCAGCHDPAFNFGDSQIIAIGVDNNGISGPSRTGPRNQRRAPFSTNAVFYKALMWTPRFFPVSGDPFDNTGGFVFPAAAGGLVTTVQTLLMAQGAVAPTELVEMGGFTGTTGTLDPAFAIFDDGHGVAIPDPSHDPIQAQVNGFIGQNATYRQLFGNVFNNGVPVGPNDITTDMRRTAIGEFQSTLLAADAPLDQFARGSNGAMTTTQKRGALLFFGKAGCVSCHAVSGGSNEMFSDFLPHRIGAPQLFPNFGVGLSNTIYDGPGQNEDFGFEQTEGNSAVRYSFRTAPLRNLKAAPGFMHNGGINSIKKAIKHHLDPVLSLNTYNPAANGVPSDLMEGPFSGILAAGLDPGLPSANLTNGELDDLVEFVTNGLYDSKVEGFCSLIPASVPSGFSVPVFENCN